MTGDSNSSQRVKLGKYIIESELGHGAMGVVYKGFDPFIERTVALKTIRKDLIEHQEIDTILTRFKREAQAAGRINHPNIVAVYEYDEDGDTAFIAMEFVQGRSLKDFFDKNERFDLSDIVRIMSQILGALSYAHEHGVVHRDIKPANIILTDNAQVKIADFGVAHLESSNLTQTGMMIGTPNYMSPEQFMGNRVDGRSDLFCTGVLLYQFITGENPFDGRTIATIMHKVLSTEPVEPASLNLQVSSEFNQVIKKAIAKRPEDRFQNAGEFFDAINKAVHKEAVKSEPPQMDAEPDPGTTVVLSSPDRLKTKVQQKPDDDITQLPETEPEKPKSGKWFLSIILLLVIGILVWFIPKIIKKDIPETPSKITKTPEPAQQFDKTPKDTADTVSPSGKVIGIESTYIEGDTVNYIVQGNDDNELQDIIFQIKNMNVKALWHVSSPSAELASSFSTSGWNPGNYSYSLIFKDSAGNSREYNGSFNLAEKPDNILPEGKISNIKDSYIEGERIDIVFHAEDNKSLKKMRFEIKDSPVNKTWNISGKSVSNEFSLPTEAWRPGTYNYSFIIEDNGDNQREYTGSFHLAEKQEKEMPSAIITMKKEEDRPSEIEEKAVKDSDSPGMAVINITSYPAGADIFIKKWQESPEKDFSLEYLLNEGQLKGKTPLNLKLEPGLYEISVKKDGYYELLSELEVMPEQQIPFEVQLMKID